MSVRTSEIEASATEAQQIAEHTSAKEYFLVQQGKLIDEWADKANKLFKYILYHSALLERSSRASMNASQKSSSTNIPINMRNFTTRVGRSLRHIAF
jgi:hypothetical protein